MICILYMLLSILILNLWQLNAMNNEEWLKIIKDVDVECKNDIAYVSISVKPTLGIESVDVKFPYDSDTVFGVPNYVFDESNMKFIFLADASFVNFTECGYPYDEVIYGEDQSSYTNTWAYLLKGKIIQISCDRGREGGPLISYKDDNFWEEMEKEAKYYEESKHLYEKIKLKEVWKEEDLIKLNYNHKITPLEIIKYGHVDNDEYALIKDVRLNEFGDFYILHKSFNGEFDLNLTSFIWFYEQQDYEDLLNYILNNNLSYQEALSYIEEQCKINNESYYNFIKKFQICSM